MTGAEIRPDDVLKFWLEEVSPSDWYNSTAKLDATLRDRFEGAWEAACAGKLAHWLTYAKGALAFIILVDQFPRNMFRDTGKAFASDKQGLAAAKLAIDKGWDMRIEEPARQFFYMPLMHSENLCDQERCVRLMCERMPESGKNNMLHARAHREVIRQFGRFPYRNEALSRSFTAPEVRYLEQGGYGKTVKELQTAKAA
ncbi:DUF924 domain-containing protein [Sulfitobacter sp. S0837]|uniref:DUF924 family protein n=1 Tax=Sulfitobacter maritimus TaxID=2741719 RepID=UPI001583B322|nr:DUF924 family protein [Sulfitobacter maritimus]NUH64554.1 DUF924 domain-containing protein [Sulfitobacter maritimus]